MSETTNTNEEYVYANFILTSVATVKQHKILLDKPASYDRIQLRLDVSENLDREGYVNPADDMPTPLGVEAMVQNLTASLVLLLKTASKIGMNDGKILSYTIGELQKGFVDLREVEVSKLTFK